MSKIESEIKYYDKHGETLFRLYNNRWVCSKCLNEAVHKRRYIIKQKAIEYKGGKCEICGYDKNYAALEFHHLDPSQKDFAIGMSQSKSWEKVKNELDKCMLICSNCHRELHNPDLTKDNFQNKIDSYKKKEVLEIPSKKELEEKLNSNLSLKAIAQNYNVCFDTLKRWCNYYNIKRDKPVRPTKEEIEENLKFYNISQLSKIYKMSRNGFCKLCQRLGVNYKTSK